MPAPFLRRSLSALAVVAGLIAVAAIVLPYAASTRLVRDRIAQEISDWSGMEVAIAGTTDISVWPDLQANLTDVSLSLPGNKDRIATIDRLEIELSALSALMGTVEFSTARFIRPTVRLQDGIEPTAFVRGRIGQAILAARAIVAENRSAPDVARLPADEFGMLEFDGGRIVSVLDGTETELVSDLAGRIDWDRLNGPADAKAKGVWRGEEFAARLGSGNPLLLVAGAATPFKGSLKSTPANVDFVGKASLGDNPYLEGQVSFASPSARKMLEWSQADVMHGTAIGAVAMESRVTGDAKRLRFEEAEFTLDGKPAQGALDLILTGKLPMVTGTLAFDTLDLRAFLSAFTPLDASVGTGPGVIDAKFAGRLNLDLRLSAAQAAVGAVALASLAATARVDQGLAAFDISDAAAFGGNIQAGLRFDHKKEATEVELRLLATDIEGGAFATAAGLTRLAPIGRGTVSVILTGQGNSWDALLSNADGSFSANFGQGALSGIDLEKVLSHVTGGAPFTLEDVAGNASPIDALELKATIVDGSARIEKAEVRSPLHRIEIAGTAQLTGELNLTGRAGPPLQAAAGAANAGAGAPTFLVSGPWRAPRLTPANGLSAE